MTCDLAVRFSGLDYNALAAYLCDGVTRSPLSDIATKVPAHGGIGLVRDTSQQRNDLFGNSPSAIIVTKPETYLKFLKLLEGKEHLLHNLAVRDLEPKTLGAETRAAILHPSIIAFAEGYCKRSWRKCMLLLYFQPEASFSGNLHNMG